MTREEAIDILVGVIAANSEEENEALDMAIEALKREDIMLKEIERVVLYGERSEE